MHPHHIDLLDYMAVAVVAGSLTQVIPATAAILAVVWYCIQIWESDTVKGWLNRDLDPPDESGEA